jgi:hypothetical protein
VSRLLYGDLTTRQMRRVDTSVSCRDYGSIPSDRIVAHTEVARFPITVVKRGLWKLGLSEASASGSLPKWLKPGIPLSGVFPQTTNGSKVVQDGEPLTFTARSEPFRLTGPLPGLARNGQYCGNCALSERA